MPFSLAYVILCICSIYLALEKVKKIKEDVNKVWTPSTHLQRKHINKLSLCLF